MGEGILKKKRIGIERQVDEFLDRVSEAGLLCKTGMDAYLKGSMDTFALTLESIRETEHKGDDLRRAIETELYRKTLIPESRGDVMELLEDMDTLLDRFTGLIWQFEIERPEICTEFHEDFRELLQYSIEAVEADVRSCRAFFKEIHVVSDHIHKVSFWEKESDKVSTRIQKAIFSREDLRLSHRMHLRFFVKQVDRIADEAEDVADRLNIYVLKRML
jgi:predicted phosphate transport protein (TIGR00153 family)